MNENKKMGSSPSSSFTSDLFGSNESSASSSSGIYRSIFSPSSKVLGRESLRSEAVEKKQDYASQVWTTKSGAAQGIISRRSEGENQSPTNEDKCHFYPEQKVQPCHLSSSIYYGGQDVYSHPQKTQDSGHTTFNNDGGEDDSGSASRGNWWQGSLYY
ncbi:Amidophosphoribosyltransferase [Actinidia chinensis var. chinensis]|uniref:Amidophosphoribosyltransferase n=1 Tax=Actinidia chinensis var. chinensis TaxID=1590841 RepID=A0A2R6R8C3_ACTCC|nr:Amidophosphoribosyltransferase [Actinidia chinensis var. chinensis]